MRLKRSKLSEKQSARLLEHFVAGTPARTAAELAGVNKNSAVLYYHRLREIIAARIEDESPISGEIEIDESYFGGVRRGKRGRGAVGKVPVFGILKRGGRVYTKMVPDARKQSLLPIIRAKIMPDSIIYSDCHGTYDLLFVEGFRHQRINHRYNFALGPKRHINGIENFWNPSGIYASTTAFLAATSISSSRSASGASIMARQPSS